MRLKPGEMAPSFEVKDMEGHDFTVGGPREGWLLLSFYRYVSCPFCNLRIHHLSKKAEELAPLGLTLAAVFSSPVDKVKQGAGSRDLGYPLIPDPTQKLYSLYQLERSWFGLIGGMLLKMPLLMVAMAKGFFPGSIEGGINRMPADFLIDPKGKIRLAYYGADLGDHLPVHILISSVLKNEV